MDETEETVDTEGTDPRTHGGKHSPPAESPTNLEDYSTLTIRVFVAVRDSLVLEAPGVAYLAYIKAYLGPYVFGEIKHLLEQRGGAPGIELTEGTWDPKRATISGLRKDDPARQVDIQATVDLSQLPFMQPERLLLFSDDSNLRERIIEPWQKLETSKAAITGLPVPLLSLFVDFGQAGNETLNNPRPRRHGGE